MEQSKVHAQSTSLAHPTRAEAISKQYWYSAKIITMYAQNMLWTSPVGMHQCNNLVWQLWAGRLAAIVGTQISIQGFSWAFLSHKVWRFVPLIQQCLHTFPFTNVCLCWLPGIQNYFTSYNWTFKNLAFDFYFIFPPHSVLLSTSLKVRSIFGVCPSL